MFKRNSFRVVLNQACAGRFAEFRFTAVVDEFFEWLKAAILANIFWLVQAEQHSAIGGVVLGIIWNEDQFFDWYRFVVLVTALSPGFRDAQAPTFLQKRQISIWPTEQQHFALEGIAAGKYGKVLTHNGIGQGVHNLSAWNARFHQVHDVCLSEHATFGGNVVQLGWVEFEDRNLFTRHPDFNEALIDGCTGARCALVVHRGLRGLVAGFFGGFEHDDLGVLAAELNHRTDIWMHFFNSHRDGVYFLHKLRAQLGSDWSTT